jgi:cytochrome c553
MLLTLMTSVTLLVWGNALWANDNTIFEPQTTACNTCHGANGNNKNLQGPNLAGQNHLYLIKQITAFTNGNRIHPLLSSADFNFDSEEVINLASYYARLKPETSLNNLSDDSELIYSTCADCHGAEGEGISPFPRLNGQKASYLEQQLVNFKTGVRQNIVMQAISINLTDEEIKRLALYLGSRYVLDEMMSGEIVSNEAR